MAIARDTSLGIQVLGTTGGTYAYTCTGSDRLLLVYVFVQYATAYTGFTRSVTYNGVSMTELGHTGTTAGSDVQGVIVFGLLNPASGANNIVVTAQATASVCYSMAASYTGVSQSGLPDSIATNKANTQDLTVTTTVVASNCWLFTCSYAERTQTYTSGATAIQGNASQVIMGDSNATVGTGSQSVIIHLATSANLVGGIVVSIAPLVAASGPANLKSLNTNVKANIKSINGNLLANIKSLNTNV